MVAEESEEYRYE